MPLKEEQNRQRGSETQHLAQNSAFDLTFYNGANKSDSLTVGCGRKRNASNKCYHARTDPIGRWGQSS